MACDFAPGGGQIHAIGLHKPRMKARSEGMGADGLRAEMERREESQNEESGTGAKQHRSHAGQDRSLDRKATAGCGSIQKHEGRPHANERRRRAR